MFGNAEENTLNFTLFMKNVSDVSYSCIDAGENLFVYAMYKFNTFGRDMNNVFLAGLQNLLGNVLNIQKIAQQLEKYAAEGNSEAQYFAYGKIFKMVADFDTVDLETAGVVGGDTDDIYLQPIVRSQKPRMHPIVK